MGVSYINGTGIAYDEIYAHMWLNISASNGTTEGALLRDDVQRLMSKEEITIAQKLARECVAKGYKDC